MGCVCMFECILDVNFCVFERDILLNDFEKLL